MCMKQSYPNLYCAGRALECVRDQPSVRRREKGIYRCPTCGSLHLTSAKGSKSLTRLALTMIKPAR